MAGSARILSEWAMYSPPDLPTIALPLSTKASGEFYRCQGLDSAMVEGRYCFASKHDRLTPLESSDMGIPGLLECLVLGCLSSLSVVAMGIPDWIVSIEAQQVARFALNPAQWLLRQVKAKQARCPTHPGAGATRVPSGHYSGSPGHRPPRGANRQRKIPGLAGQRLE